MKQRKKKSIIIWFLCVVLTSGTIFPIYTVDLKAEDLEEDVNYVQDEILVMYSNGVDHDQIMELAESKGDYNVEVISETNEGVIASISLSEDTSVQEAADEYLADERVIEAVPNYELELFNENAVNDSYIGQQTYLSQIGCFQAWSIINSTVHNQVKVAVLDTGADIRHPDLEHILNPVESKEVVDESGTLMPLKGDGYQNGIYTSGGGHGTHVSGIIAAEANNGIGIAGVASSLDNSVIDLVVVDVFSEEEKTSLKYVIKGLEYAKEIGAKVVNLSLGVQKSSINNDALLESECNSLAEKGMIIVCAAGNYGANDSGKVDVVPSDYESTISVIGLNGNQKSPVSCYGSKKDISAPGTDILSTIKNSKYGTMSGTSMAAPIVTAVVAMMCSIQPDLKVEDVKDILSDSAIDLGTPGYDIFTGAGMVNAGEALKKVRGISEPAEEIELPFVDVHTDDWFYDAVGSMYKQGIMMGLRPTVFGPSGEVSRAQFATILYRMSGEEEIQYSSIFPDISQGQFYTDAVLWAADKGIVTGYMSGFFGPSNPITREEMSVMLYRYARFHGYNNTNRISLSKFPDNNQVSGFAQDAVKWACAEEIIKGNGKGLLAPRASTDRAACAMMIMRFMNEYY